MSTLEKTKRQNCYELEEVLEEKIPVLDKGFIRVVDYMGCDSSIVQAARVSYGKGTKTVSQDRDLINYLMRNRHTTPFEMCEIKFHIKLPLFVARQWIRHRTANVNEYSARYSVVEDDFYFPDKSKIGYQSKSNNQGTEGKVHSDASKEFLSHLKNNTDSCYESYKKFLESGISREISRTTLPLNCYTQFYWKIDLHNLLNFIALRASKNAQYEIREYANKIDQIVKKWTPMTHDAFHQYVTKSFKFSEKGMKFLREKLKGKEVSAKDFGIGKREEREMLAALES